MFSGVRDDRLVAPTFYILKTPERLRPMVKLFLDPLHFAYWLQLGVEDSIIYCPTVSTHTLTVAG